MGGAFSPATGLIVLCEESVVSNDKKKMEATIAHELVHMYDHCRFKVDWSNLRHHACSEVRLLQSFILSAHITYPCIERFEQAT